MSEREKKDNKRKNLFLDDFFQQFNEFFQDMLQNFNPIVDNYSNNDPITFGYSMNIGPDTDYRPEIRQWGNLEDFRKQMNLPKLNIFSEEPQSRLHQPIQYENYDIIDQGNNLMIITEVPGFGKDDINVEINEDGRLIYINGTTDDRNISNEIPLPTAVLADTSKSKINNGVLEITIEKKKGLSQGKKLKIDIE